jgi:hypothetical protein
MGQEGLDPGKSDAKAVLTVANGTVCDDGGGWTFTGAPKAEKVVLSEALARSVLAASAGEHPDVDGA